ncbi:hypothetical protein GCM10009416_47470 [Craurococcus roseus]|uniref:Uncharacterized protein n=1 Tax=Craurococcus roseus TaxID=77585 RepID=A0ABN1G586_9PROT
MRKELRSRRSRRRAPRVSYDGEVSKSGDVVTRISTSGTDGVLLARVALWPALKAWGARLAKRRAA